MVIAATTICSFLSGLALAPLGPAFAAYGAPLLRWVGLAVPATAVNLLFWATCLVRRRPWPVFALNLTTSGAIIGGVMLLGSVRRHQSRRNHLLHCAMAHCRVVSFPTIMALRVIRQRQESR